MVSLGLHDICELASSMFINSCSVSLEYDTSTVFRQMAVFTNALAPVPGWYSSFSKTGTDTLATMVSLSNNCFAKQDRSCCL